MYTQSEFPTQVASGLHLPNSETALVYGDPAYFLGTGVIGGFRNHRHREMTEPEPRFNRHMARQRMRVEWGFGKAVMQLGFMGHKSNIKVGLSPVGAYYAVCILLSNVHIC